MGCSEEAGFLTWQAGARIPYAPTVAHVEQFEFVPPDLMQPRVGRKASEIPDVDDAFASILAETLKNRHDDKECIAFQPIIHVQKQLAERGFVQGSTDEFRGGGSASQQP